MVIHSIASAQSRVAILHLIVHELLVFLVVQWQSRPAKALGPQKSMVFGLIVRPLGLGACLGSVAVEQVVFFVASHTIFLSSFIRFDVLV
jgi:hypothetical protein